MLLGEFPRIVASEHLPPRPFLTFYFEAGEIANRPLNFLRDTLRVAVAVLIGIRGRGVAAHDEFSEVCDVCPNVGITPRINQEPVLRTAPEMDLANRDPSTT